VLRDRMRRARGTAVLLKLLLPDPILFMLELPPPIAGSDRELSPSAVRLSGGLGQSTNEQRLPPRDTGEVSARVKATRVLFLASESSLCMDGLAWREGSSVTGKTWCFEQGLLKASRSSRVTSGSSEIAERTVSSICNSSHTFIAATSGTASRK